MCGLKSFFSSRLFEFAKLRAYRAYVSSCLNLLRALRASVPIYIFRAYVPMCLKPLISTLYNKVNDQLNIIGRIKKYMGFKENCVLLTSFVCAKFNYCFFVWYSCTSRSLYKNYKNRHLDYYITTLPVIMLNP